LGCFFVRRVNGTLLISSSRTNYRIYPAAGSFRFLHTYLKELTFLRQRRKSLFLLFAIRQ
jgi:hypothetical protein